MAKFEHQLLAIKAEKVTLSLINTLGTRVMITYCSINEGSNELLLNVGHLKSGTY